MNENKYKYTLLKKKSKNDKLENGSYKKFSIYIVLLIVFIYIVQILNTNHTFIFENKLSIIVNLEEENGTQYSDDSSLRHDLTSILNHFTDSPYKHETTEDYTDLSTSMSPNIISSVAETTTYWTISSFMPSTSVLNTSAAAPTTKTFSTDSTLKYKETNSSLNKISTPIILMTRQPNFPTKEKFGNSTELLSKIQKYQTTVQKVPKTIKPVKYYVNTPHCKMPWVDPFTPAIRKIFKPNKYINCSHDKPLVTSSFNISQQRYILHIHYINEEDASCCYQQIIRTGSGASADKSAKLLPCVNFRQDFVVPIQVDAMIVKCVSKESKKLLQQDAFSFIQEQHPNKFLSNITNNTSKPSVFLIGIDSLSRFNFRRNMPKTLSFLEKNNWFELQGYNKIGDNTFPNLMSLLVGLNESMAYSKCKPRSVGGLDACDFIWKKFKAHGYKTAFAEDTSSISTFTYLKKGFLKPPTDYYLRPMVLATEKNCKSISKYGFKFCIGRKQSAEYIYDFGLEFANRYREKPGFGLFWTNSFSHNSYSSASTMDVKMQEYFQKIKNDGIANTSIILFFSDHGSRWGPLLKLPEGFLEERLPMFFLSLPNWFQETYPDFVKAIKVNKNRLTTPFDIYQTLNHILNLGTIENQKITTSESCPTAQSLFNEVPESRTCKDACIPEHWCTCDPYEVLPKIDPVVKNVTNLIVDEINNYLINNNFSSLCHPLKTNFINEAHIKIETEQHSLLTETIRVKFTTLPKTAEFQATAIYDLQEKSIRVVIENISRLNTYAKYSKCIENKLAKKFCMCKK